MITVLQIIQRSIQHSSRISAECFNQWTIE